jgi:hypothetical protein
MDPKNNADRILAAHLSRPFLLPGQPGQPLSFRALPDGGMVVIASDGRKLWFTPREVQSARRELNFREQPLPKTSNLPKDKVLNEPVPGSQPITSRPTGGSRDGKSEKIFLPDSLKHLERKPDDHIGRSKNPRPPGA